MLTYADIDASKRAVVFELDNVLYPEKDYLLQVYYLFASFVEYTEAYPPAEELIAFFKRAYEMAGPADIFDKASAAFGLEEKYRNSFARLHTHANLPLKLLLYKESLQLLRELSDHNKHIFIVTGGDPLQQLNKIRQIEWQGLEHSLRVYFADEVKPKPDPDVLYTVMSEHNLRREDVLVAGVAPFDEIFARNAGIDFVRI